MTSTRELIASIPPYMVGIISSKIIGQTTDAMTLSEWLSDAQRLQQIILSLNDHEKSILRDLFELGGQMEWRVFLRTYRHEINKAHTTLERLGMLGLVFQDGLTGRDPVIMLPSLITVMEEMLKADSIPDDTVVWKEPQEISIWSHIIVLNAFRAGKIRCRPGMEPFKKGWESIEERIGESVDVRRIYWELEVLGCLRDSKGTIIVLPGPSMSLAIDGELRYRIWRFFQSCKLYQGLEGRIFKVLGEKGHAKETLQRTIFFYLIHAFPEMEDVEQIPSDLISLWLELGILQEDISGRWVRFSDEVFKALRTGNIRAPLPSYKDEVIIQPNMEILVSKDFDPVDHLNIGEVAELVRADVVSIYRITRASVFRAIRDGWSAEKIGNFLDRISRHTVPENVLKTIKGWAASLSQAHIIHGTFLVIENCRDKIPHGLDEVLPGIYRIPERCEDDVITFLDRRSVIIQRSGCNHEEEGEMDWGRSIPLKIPEHGEDKALQKEGIYPFGMVKPLPYGHKGIEIFEEAIAQEKSLIIFYPKYGYGEIQVYKISPIDIFTKGGGSFMEASCDDSGVTEVFDISKIRAYLKHT